MLGRHQQRMPSLTETSHTQSSSAENGWSSPVRSLGPRPLLRAPGNLPGLPQHTRCCFKARSVSDSP